MKVKPRVAIVSTYPYLDEDRSLGGVNQSVYNLVHALSTLGGIELHVLTCAPVERYQHVQKDVATTIHYFPPRNRSYDTLLLYSGRRASVQRLLEQIQPDIVHAQEPVAYILSGILSPYPCIITVHGVMRQYYRAIARSLSLPDHVKWIINCILEAYNFRHIENLIAITPEIEQLVRRASPKARVFRINNPIDNRYFHVMDKQSTEPVILFSGFVIHRKGVDVLLEAVRSLLADVPNVTVRIAGSVDWDPRYVSFLRNEYSDLFRPKRVVFLGLLDVKHMADEYARCSLLCLPARAESAPMVIAEAMAAGKPVVATRVGGIPEMVEDGATGRLCVPGDPGQLAACLRELLTNDDLRRDMGERARCAAIQRYRADSVARATLDAYLRVLNTPSSSS